MSRSSISVFVLAVLLLVSSVPGPASAQQGGGSAATPANKADSSAGSPFNGIWTGTYTSNQAGQTKIIVMLQQIGNTVTGTYAIPGVGSQGVIYGSTASSGPSKFDADQKTPACPGHFAMEAAIADGIMKFSFKGTHCAGTEIGSGSVTKQK